MMTNEDGYRALRLGYWMLLNDRMACSESIDRLNLGSREKMMVLGDRLTNKQKGYYLIKLAINFHVAGVTSNTDKTHGIYGFIDGKRRLLRRVGGLKAANIAVRNLKKIMHVPYTIKEIS